MDVILSLPVLISLIIVALAFDFLNGLHDTANSIATLVSTRMLRPRYAVLWAAFFNFIAFLVFGVHVARTIGVGIVSAEVMDAHVIFGALMGAISWNLITWWAGIPSSSSHALIGGLVGAGVTKAALASIVWPGLEEVTIRWRGSYGYVTAWTSEDDGVPVCRLEYLGVDDVWGFALYDPATDTWDDAAIADLPETRSFAASAVYNGKWILAGGDVAFSISTSVIAWDPATNAWSNLLSMLHARDLLGGAVAGCCSSALTTRMFGVSWASWPASAEVLVAKC